MRGAVEEGTEAVFGFGFADGRVGLSPIGLGLIFKSRKHHGDGFVKFAKDLGFRRAARFREFQIAIANVAGLGDLSADVIVEIAGEVEQEVAGTVAVRIGIGPKLFVGKRIDPSVNVLGSPAVFAGEAGGDGLRQSRHSFTFQRAAAVFSFL
jgi:hypothetical protein